MMRTRTVIAGFLLAAIVAGRTAAAAPGAQRCDPAGYDFVTVDVPGAAGTIVQHINDQGDLAGVAGLEASAWIRRNGVISTYALGETGSAEMNAINNPGVVVGDYFGTDGKLHGFTFENGLFEDLDHPGASFTLPARVNDRGTVVGTYTTDPAFEGGFHGFTLRKGVFTSFAHPGAGPFGTFASGNNNRGEIVGFYFDSAGGHSFLYSRGRFTAVAVPGAVYTQAAGISDHGHIVGHYQTTPGLPAFMPEHGFLLVGGSYCTLDVPDAAATRLFSINNRGQIAGWFVDGDGNNHGFVATPR